MPTKFSEEEQKRIKQKLIAKGTKLFSRYGFSKTSVKEITEAAGISKGAFYSFFDSKAELYYYVVEAEAQKIREKAKNILTGKNGNAKDQIRKFMHFLLNRVENNNLTRRLFEENEFEKVVQKLGPDKMDQHRQFSFDAFVPIFRKWQEKGEIIEGDPEVLLGVIRAVFAVALHKEEIGEDIFPEVMDKLIEFVSQGIGKE